MLRVIALSLALTGVLASPAWAAKVDNGPYSPFPEGDPSGDAVKLVQRLNQERFPVLGRGSTAAAIKRLERGTAVGPDGRPLPAEDAAGVKRSEAFTRAGVTGDRPPSHPTFLLALALLLALAGVAFELRGRRVRSRAARAG
jgi:hypothetical protein